jgi:tetratricopeptide (TPR) repeat protein
MSIIKVDSSNKYTYPTSQGVYQRKPMQALTPKSRIKIAVTLAVILTGLSCLVFLPGISGPFVFDDFSNIVGNKFLRFDTLTFSNLFQAAMSSDSGPLKRPLAMLTFALNAWFAGGTNTSEPFKIWNLAIHAVNSILILILTYQIFTKRGFPLSQSGRFVSQLTLRHPLFFATFVAILWAVHPIQITSVLYIVQRMTSLSALFVLLAMISYIAGRQYQETNRARFFLFCFLLPLVLVILGLASKENAALFPFYILSLELTLYGDRPIWANLQRIRILRNLVQPWFVLAVAAILLGVSVYIFLPEYSGRTFAMGERLLTESRVVATYIYLILLPRLSGFGIHHDDIVLSHGLLTPPTTLWSIVFLVTLIILAWKIRRRLPLISFGILFFFAGQILESTVAPLEIMHEHRNYLPSYGLLLAGVAGVTDLSDALKNRLVLLVLPGLLILFSFTSYVRSGDWSNIVSLYSKEVIHHPNSIRSLTEFSGVLHLLHRNKDAMEMLNHAIELKPNNPVLYMELRKYEKTDTPETREQDKKISELLKHYPLNPSLKIQLESVLNCLPKGCRHLLKPYEQWLWAIINRGKRVNDPSYFTYLMGKTYLLEGRGTDAIHALEISKSLDRKYMQPRFLLFYVYVDAKRLKDAARQLDEIKKVSAYGRFKWINEINKAQAVLDSRLKNK